VSIYLLLYSNKAGLFWRKRAGVWRFQAELHEGGKNQYGILKNNHVNFQIIIDFISIRIYNDYTMKIE